LRTTEYASTTKAKNKCEYAKSRLNLRLNQLNQTLNPLDDDYRVHGEHMCTWSWISIFYRWPNIRFFGRFPCQTPLANAVIQMLEDGVSK